MQESARFKAKLEDQPCQLAGLNDQQRAAVTHGELPLLIVAGAGTGKTHTLVHRVANLLRGGVRAERILLLTFTRRASAEMLRRVAGLVGREASPAARPRRGAEIARVWGGTFHATACRLLRMHGAAIGLDADFTILDRADAEDLMNVVRTDIGLADLKTRFPKKGTCLAIYSHCVNSQLPLAQVLQAHYPWCLEYTDSLKKLFQHYVRHKDFSAVLDYDDLLLFWRGLMVDPVAGPAVRDRFECVLVDEYQDTNRLQADILEHLCLDGRGLTAVGDDCQSIYSFRAATVRNMLDFPKTYPQTTIVKLEQNYRSTPSILDATNAVIGEARDQFRKKLWSDQSAGQPPLLVTCDDEWEQTDEIVRQVLDHREGDLALRNQAILYRASHHSILLEGELRRHNIPYVKFGGLKFIETAHIKDVISVLRFAENPRDVVAGQRLLMLLPGIGPKTAQRLLDPLQEGEGGLSGWEKAQVPGMAREEWSELVGLLSRLRAPDGLALPAQMAAICQFYKPLLEIKYDQAAARWRDVQQLEELASRFADRRAMLVELALDPPSSSADLARPAQRDEDYLVLSTIHSAKGLEWDAVYVIHASDGHIPSDLATDSVEQIDEERRLFYVALTRAKRWLYVYYPRRYANPRSRRTDRSGLGQLTRFLSDAVQQRFTCRLAGGGETSPPAATGGLASKRRRIRRSTSSLWD
ncbi:MAG: UvrD-helicase domain-containing protein [Planctomycetales bacterium]|nr:UvrD-helicase domain-containing protein [Planctomycetales bacterium]NIN08217.1 UvrD-helicase domain-containing protein [Planctomycetales bacterium]NIO46332.1 UvrD-helicase domain-containing protein [Planctomycetales bacterium]NIP04395.1 UvrD-helicase domain-containing protein [Planctomycetales bacterium]NIP69288.1 UvrD-helicase domain-containing protein [Planctomycetales bacterium]